MKAAFLFFSVWFAISYGLNDNNNNINSNNDTNQVPIQA